MQRTRPGPAQNGIKQRALKVMKQKKMYVLHLPSPTMASLSF
jgi:hypothetical protein